MSAPRRRALPDNLDPLVDTLSNVVGILVIAIALTQLELSDAVARVARAVGLPAAAPGPAVPIDGNDRGDGPALEALRATLAARGTPGAPADAERLERLLADLASRPAAGAGDGGPSRDGVGAEKARAALEARVAQARVRLEEARANDVHRREYARSIVEVPKQLVARVPDPQIVEGREAWILVRYGRVYPVDRKALFERGQQAIGRIIQDGMQRVVRPDEFASIAHYLRKSEVGLGPFRWRLELEPAVRVVLDWRTRAGGIERTRLAASPELARFLDGLDAGLDVIRFQVWSDSFEAYLEARTLVEARGFRASWTGHDVDDELSVALEFRLPSPDIQRRGVD